MTGTIKKTKSADQGVVSMYLKDINKIALINRDEETKLAIRAAKGDMAARNKIVQANLRFVVTVAKRYQNHGIELADLISEGNIGLLTAIERFDISKGYHFISYAVWWIRQAILKYICEKSRMIRLPLNRSNELMNIEKARKTLLGGKSEREEVSEVAQILNMNPSLVEELSMISRNMISLDAPVRAVVAGSAAVGEFIEDHRYETPENYVVSSAMTRDINNALRTLSKREAEILRYRYGLNGNKAHSLREVGNVMHLTKERIRQIEKKAIRRLQTPAQSLQLEGYVA
jgi:RNA polymerase primary sigma factor